MPISPAQQANATTIVQQALDKGMGVRSAVIAVATSMQESQLQNLSYGDQDSLGLFQQRPSMGWGTAQQITTPSYAADAFLTALKQQQASNPGWAHQPLWANAQAVQKSGFPFAYAKWETQAVQLVKTVVTQVKYVPYTPAGQAAPSALASRSELSVPRPRPPRDGARCIMSGPVLKAGALPRDEQVRRRSGQTSRPRQSRRRSGCATAWSPS